MFSGSELKQQKTLRLESEFLFRCYSDPCMAKAQLSYLSKDQALAVADTILRTFKAARLSIRQNR